MDAAETKSFGADLLDLHDLLKPEVIAELSKWWSSLPIVGRQRGRWVFQEPAGIPGKPGAAPRQHVRRTIPVVFAGEAPGAGGVERHNKSSINRVAEGEHLEEWKRFALRSTNQDLCHTNFVPYKKDTMADEIWIRAQQKSHGPLLKEGAMKLIEDWQQAGASTRQKSAFSELLRSLAKHMALKRGVTETKVAYGPKAAETVAIYRIDPFYSSLGSADATAPVAHAVRAAAPPAFSPPSASLLPHPAPLAAAAPTASPPLPPSAPSQSQRKMEDLRKKEFAAQLAKAEATLAERAAKGKSKDDIDTLKSKIPFKWPGAEMFFFQPSSSQLQQRTVGPADTARAKEINPKSECACPPASNGMGRCIGGPRWHGDSHHDYLRKVIRDKQLHLPLGDPTNVVYPKTRGPRLASMVSPGKEDDKLRHTMAHINEVLSGEQPHWLYKGF